MAKYGSLLFCYISNILILTTSLVCRAANEDRKASVIFVAKEFIFSKVPMTSKTRLLHINHYKLPFYMSLFVIFCVIINI